MGNEIYELVTESDVMNFQFTSIGPKGHIPKLVMYSKTPTKGIYNLGFGDRDPLTGKIDDTVVTDNKDSQKVLATVASTVYQFVKKIPACLDRRNRQYKSKNSFISNGYFK